MESNFNLVILILNVLGFLLVVYDKKQAKTGQWRVAEKYFFIVGLLGGAAGILIGMKLIRHKTKHLAFTMGMPLIVALNLVVYYFIQVKMI